MFCTQCGSKNAPESKFCTNCGNPLVSVPVQPDAGQAWISDDFSVDSTAVETPASQLAPQSAEQPEEQSAAQHEDALQNSSLRSRQTRFRRFRCRAAARCP